VGIVEAVATGVFSSLAASILWLALFRAVRPKIDISAQITEDATGDGRRNQIKIINRTTRPVYDIKIELSEIRPKRTRGGIVQRKFLIPVENAPFMLPGRVRRDKEYANCYRLTIHDLRAHINGGDSDYLRLRVLARDSLSGIGKVFEQRYYDNDDIVRCRWIMGESFDIIQGGVEGDN